ncbi:MAG: hypothetical protein GY882_11575 [Actinomycetia bacterium]|nr:hypothetical protein [Actinomycetes bacterium]MCP4843486.1 hypothetical protein [Actinomycetes bacterium]
MSEKRTVPMICATDALRPPKARIAQITPNFVLPRSVEVVKAVAGLAGCFVTWMFLLILPVPFGMKTGALIVLTGGALGVVATVWSPIRNENLAQWAMLAMRRRSRRVELLDPEKGKMVPVQLAVGIARVKGVTLGEVNMRPSAVDVLVGSVDERGAFVGHDAAVVATPDATQVAQANELLGRHVPAGSSLNHVRHARIRARAQMAAEDAAGLAETVAEGELSRKLEDGGWQAPDA